MARVNGLTPAQREADLARKRRETLALCLSNYKHKTGKTNEELAEELGTSQYSIRKILNQEPAKLCGESVIKLLNSGGFKVVREAVQL